ncbi:WD40 repeat domain-containing serine/threonine protein kinase [Sphaerisporangium aureirubrum]|uniref:non-specific serine/threonine protein kinase n=1 Tax=Sphaerisporangium aureirubrum TaxID=1544736 RepID=A0ABW1NTX6_9ACTN
MLVAEDVGTVVAGRYRLVRLLGEGGMGSAWQAVDERLRRNVAIKQLRMPPGMRQEARDQLVARVEREAQAAGGLRHRGIITVYDQITDERGLPWIVMELISGRSLNELVDEGGRLSLEWVARIGAEVASALAAAHAAGIVHRDVKPANILLEGDRVVLTDFGIASLEGDTTLTPTGVVIGTPAYMAPEQIDGKEATAASDMWSLGATLYTAAEGRPPFSGPTTAALLMAVSRGKPAPMVHAGALQPLLRELMSKNPDARPTASRAATALLRPAAAPTRPQTRRPTRSTRPAREPLRMPPLTRRRLLIGLGAGLVGAVPVAYFLTRDGTPSWDAPTSLGPALPGHGEEILTLGFGSDGATLVSASGDDVVRWWKADTRAPIGRPLTTGAGSLFSMVLSHDATCMAVAGNEGTGDAAAYKLRLWDMTTRKAKGEISLQDPGDYPRQMVFSADGKTLAVFHHYDFQIRLYDTATLKQLAEFARKGNDADGMAMSRDGKMIATSSEVGNASELQLWDVTTRVPVEPALKYPRRTFALGYSPDGMLLAAGDANGTVSLWDPNTSTLIGSLPRRHAGSINTLAFSRDGAVLATGGADKKVWLWDVSSRRSFAKAIEQSDGITALAFNPGGTVLAVGAADGKVQLWRS